MKRAVAILLAFARAASADESLWSPPEPDRPHDDAVGSDLPSPAPSGPKGKADVSPERDKPAAQPSVKPTPAPASLSYGGEVDVSSRYVWRGLAFSQHPVLQPSLRLSEHGVTLGVASNAYLGREPGVEDTISELDFTGRYDVTLGATTFSPSLGAYLYPHAPSTAELGAALSYDLQVVALQTHQSLDIADNAGGWFADVAAARSQSFGPRLRLNGAASLGWCSGSFARYYIDQSISGLHWSAAQLDMSLVVSATELLYFRLHGTASRMLERQIRSLQPDESLVSGGLALGMTR